MVNVTSYGSSTEVYTSSGGFTPTVGGYNYTGGQENNGYPSIWDSAVAATMTWDILHWSTGWAAGLLFVMIVFGSCNRFCPQRRPLRVALAILAFAVGWWAYSFVILFMAIVFQLLFFSFFFWWLCCMRCGFKERRQIARMVMERALSNPSWRRRSWLVVLRARRTRHLQTRRWRCPRGGCVLPLTTVDETIMANDSWPSGADDSFQQIVMKVVDLPEEELFRRIVFYI